MSCTAQNSLFHSLIVPFVNSTRISTYIEATESLLPGNCSKPSLVKLYGRLCDFTPQVQRKHPHNCQRCNFDHVLCRGPTLMTPFHDR